MAYQSVNPYDGKILKTFKPLQAQEHDNKNMTTEKGETER